MHSIRNKAVINRVSKRMVRVDRTRNIFSIMAIVLTTFMISVIFSIGISFMHNYNIYKIRDNGSMAHISLPNPTDDQYETISKLDYIEHAGLRIYAGSVKVTTEDEQNVNISMIYFDKIEWEKHYKPAISDILGNYPVKEDEIMLSSKAMEILELENSQVGSRITLTHNIKGVESTKEYTLAGLFRNYSISDEGGIPLILVSEEFCQTHELGIEDYGTVTISAPSNKEIIVYDQLLDDIALKEKQKFSAVFDISSTKADAWAGAAIIIMISLFIVLSGYLLIYNIMYISISKDIRFYGMLKTIGTTPRQIKKIVRNQLYLLAVVGIPIGLFIGVMVSFIMVPAAMNVMGGATKDTIMPSEISFHPFIFIATTLFTLLTIAISLRKPARVAGSVSPVEALRYTESKKSRKKKEKRTTKGDKIFFMAFNNVLRDKKKAALVFASLFMGCITLLSINSFLNSINVENYLNRYVPHNFEYRSNVPYSVDKFDKHFLDTIKAMDGIEKVETIHSAFGLIEFDAEALEGVLRNEYSIHAAKDNSYEMFLQWIYQLSKQEDFYEDLDISYGTWLLAVDDIYVEEYNKINENKIDLKDFHEGKLVLMSGDSNEYLQSMIGKTLTVINSNSNISYDITIGGLIGRNNFKEALYYPHVVGAPNTNIDFRYIPST
ncbi:MAG: FtsX-like permease family protein [Clostridiales bacterium]|nr:FtsX-like permease family protein [Clostridiales bacterium]